MASNVERPQPPSSDFGGPSFTQRGDLERRYAKTPKADESDGEGQWLRLAKEAFDFSTSYVDSNYRPKWEDSIRAFNNQHPMKSKYNSAAYDKRSKIFRPKTRAIIRKNEAAAAAAYFSNMDVVSVEAERMDDKSAQASADIMKHLLQYRLTKSLPWFLVTMGALQDTQTMGACIAHVHWEYEEQKKVPDEPEFESDADRREKPDREDIKVISDKPAVDLFPLENLRFDPAAKWTDPIGTSPYIIHMIPMYVQDVKGKMRTGEWKRYSDSTISVAMQTKADTTVAARTGREDARKNEARTIGDYQIVWIHRHIHKREGHDWEFYTLGTVAMLTEPCPLQETVFHGMRPYVMGKCVLEAHNILPTSIPALAEGLQTEANEIANTRMDNVKLVLQKRWIARRGKDIDYASLVRNVPGSITLVNDPEKDIRELSWPDVTQSSYAEQDRINADMDELLGNFSAGSVMTNKAAMETPMRTLGLVNTGATVLTEYLLRTFTVTFVEPVLRQLMKLEQYYETDQTVMALAGSRAKLRLKYGMDEVTDDLLNRELTLSVNVGMGATDPMMKLQKFLLGINSFAGLMKQPPPGMNLAEVGKEVFAMIGYQDGTRFFEGDDPQKAMMQKQIQQMQQQIQQLTQQVKEKQTGHMLTYRAKTEAAKAGVAREQVKQQGEDRRVAILHRGRMPEDPNAEHQREMTRLAMQEHRQDRKMQGEMALKAQKLRGDQALKAAAMLQRGPGGIS
jgi:hypothetical protein